MTPNLYRQRGAVTVMITLMIILLLAVAGLVVDSGLAYMVKARLNAAVDSAALAAARAVTAGNTQDAQRASAQAAASQFFAANIPDGYLLSKPKLRDTKVTFTDGTVTIDVTADAPMPVSLMQVIGVTSMTPVAYAQTIRRDLDMAFVVDVSGSLLPYQDKVKASATSFLNKFNVTQDRVGLIRFAYGSPIDRPISRSARGFNRDAMLSTISKYSMGGSTASVEGIWNAREELNAIPLASRSAMRVIVFFSDGEPNAFGARLAQTRSTCPYPGTITNNGGINGLYWLNLQSTPISGECDLDNNAASKLPDWYNAHNVDDDPAKREFRIVTSTPRVVTNTVSSQNIGRAAYNLAEAVAAKARDEGIIVFTLGLGSSLKNSSGYNNENNEAFLKCMANVADGPSRCYDAKKPVGMYCYAATDADLTPCFSKLASAILRISK